MKPNNLCQKIEFMETIHDPYEAQNILSNLLKSANKEVLITLPTKAAIGVPTVSQRYCHMLRYMKHYGYKQS